MTERNTLDAMLAATFEQHEVPHGSPLRNHPGAVETVLEDLYAHELSTRRYNADNMWPVVVDTIERHLVWVEADSEAAAVKAVREDDTWYERLSAGDVIDGGFHAADPLETYELTEHVYHQDQGPANRCGTCLHNPPWGANLHTLYHANECPVYAAERAERDVYWARKRAERKQLAP
jgi:hypothetical protein